MNFIRSYLALHKLMRNYMTQFLACWLDCWNGAIVKAIADQGNVRRRLEMLSAMTYAVEVLPRSLRPSTAQK